MSFLRREETAGWTLAPGGRRYEMMAGDHLGRVRLSALADRFRVLRLRSLYLSSQRREMACGREGRFSWAAARPPGRCLSPAVPWKVHGGLGLLCALRGPGDWGSGGLPLRT